MIKDDIILLISNKINKSFYLYDEKEILKSISNLRENFKEFEFLYSIKTNPNENILNFISKNKIGSDAASAKEVKLSIKANIKKENIIYSTPGKTKKDIEDTYDKCIITADSYNELCLINKVAQEKNIILNVGLRINANYNVYGNEPLSSKYGVDEEGLLDHKEFIESLSNIKITGIHVHLQSQILDYNIILKYYEYVLNLSVFCIDKMDFELDFINFGGGLGISYNNKDKDLDLHLLGREVSALLDKYKDKLSCRFILESGRYIACKCGTYVTPIVDIKVSRNIKYLIVKNAYNGFFKPTISEMIVTYANDKENLKMYEPIFTSFDSYEIKLLKQKEEYNNETEIVTIGGSLCTAADIMGKDIELPKANINDLILINNAGSYAYTLTPILFSSHEKPSEVYLCSNNKIHFK